MTTLLLSRARIEAVIRFHSLAAFLFGTYNNSGFTQTSDTNTIHQTNPNAGFYAQDEWKVSDRLSLNPGLRYDLEFHRTIATDTNNVSPRGEFAWTPFASRKTVIRGAIASSTTACHCARWPTRCFRPITP